MPRRASTTCYRRSLPSKLTAIRCWPRPSTTRASWTPYFCKTTTPLWPCQRSQVSHGQGEGRVGQNVECAIATACSKDFARLVTVRGVCRTRLVVLAAGGDAKTKERCGKYKPNARKAPN